MSLTQCGARYTTMSLPPVVLSCERTDLDELGRHLGRHYGYEQETWGKRLWTWSSGVHKASPRSLRRRPNHASCVTHLTTLSGMLT